MPWEFLNFELEQEMLSFEIFPYLAFTNLGNIFSMVLKIQTFNCLRFKYLFENSCLLLLKVVLPDVFYHKLDDNTLVLVYFKQLRSYNIFVLSFRLSASVWHDFQKSSTLRA